MPLPFNLVPISEVMKQFKLAEIAHVGSDSVVDVRISADNGFRKYAEEYGLAKAAILDSLLYNFLRESGADVKDVELVENKENPRVTRFYYRLKSDSRS